ncbi:MAG: ATP synthase F1 subunit gamma [Coriobacteriia bacterium]|nr:ATP synthase F1 subunit gamma [Coriobacteriia bacterium]
MANLRDIKRRINSVVSTQQITRTMEMVATAKIRRATERIVQATPYATAMASVLQSVARRTRKPKNPLLLQHSKTSNIIVIVVSSDRGMAGGFNSSVLRTAEHFIAEMTERQIGCEIIACGSKAAAYYRDRSTPVAFDMRGNSADPTIIDAQRIASFVIDSYTSGKSDQVVMFYNHARNVADQEIRLEQVLPITQLDNDFQFGEEWESMMEGGSARVIASRVKEGVGDIERSEMTAEDVADATISRLTNGTNGTDQQEESSDEDDQIVQRYEFEPSATVVLNSLLPDFVKIRIFHALLDSAAGEQGARRKAMKSATDNATEMIDTLMRLYNRARQGAITTEITEIVGGAAALEETY